MLLKILVIAIWHKQCVMPAIQAQPRSHGLFNRSSRGKGHGNEVDTGDCPREQKYGKWARAKQGKGLGYI